MCRPSGRIGGVSGGIVVSAVQACADKLNQEIEEFGLPPNFPPEVEPAPEVIMV